jgi:hypothetical protein
VAGGSDSPIETCSPFVGMYDAVFRVGEDEEVFRPSERLSFAQALWTYTVGAAYACRTEKVLGQLKENFAGDFVVVDTAVLTNHALLKDLTPDLVVVGGHLKHACDEVMDGRGSGRGVRVYFPRAEAGEIDGDDIQMAAYRRHKRSRTGGRAEAVKMGGDFVPGKNGPRGLMSQRAIDNAKGTPGAGVRSKSTAPANGFFCACWLRGKMCRQPLPLSGDGSDTAEGVYCLPASSLS